MRWTWTIAFIYILYIKAKRSKLIKFCKYRPELSFTSVEIALKITSFLWRIAFFSTYTIIGTYINWNQNKQTKMEISLLMDFGWQFSWIFPVVARFEHILYIFPTPKYGMIVLFLFINVDVEWALLRRFYRIYF